MKFVNAESSIRISRIEVLGDTAKVSLVQSLKLSYEYIDSYPGQHDFGIGTRHGITLRKKIAVGTWNVNGIQIHWKKIQKN